MNPLNCVLPGPLSGSGLVAGAVCFVDVSDFGHQGVVWIRVGEHGTNGQQHLRNCQSRRPLISQYIQTYAPIAIDVGVVNASCEIDPRGLEWIIRWKTNLEEKYTAFICALGRSHYCCLPLKHVVTNWTGGTRGRRVTAKIYEFLIDALQSHV